MSHDTALPPFQKKPCLLLRRKVCHRGKKEFEYLVLAWVFPAGVLLLGQRLVPPSPPGSISPGLFTLHSLKITWMVHLGYPTSYKTISKYIYYAFSLIDQLSS